MSTLEERLNAQARIYPVKPHNRVKQVVKNADGSLSVTLQSGEAFDIGQGDELFQSFVVYAVLGCKG